MLSAKIENVDISKLILDPNNFRLINEKNYTSVEKNKITDVQVQKRTLNMLCGQKNENIQDLLDSFKTNGYLPVDQIQVKKIEGTESYLVLEGNRRTAALKILKELYENESIDLQKFDIEFLKAIPVVVYSGADDEVQQFIVMGLKHISGNKKWGEWNQAQLVKKLYDSGSMDEETICSSIGIDKTSLRRNLRALSLIDQYKASDYGDQFTTSLYPVFRELITYTGIKDWLDWDENLKIANNRLHVEQLFSLLSTDNEIDDNDTKKILHPAITKREEVRTLSKFIDDDNAMNVLVKTRDIASAFSISKAGSAEIGLQKFDNLLDKLSSDIGVIVQTALPENKRNELQEQINIMQSYIDKNSVDLKNSTSDVFYTKIDSHFTSICIEQYKRFNDINLSNLKRINIFAGINNSGKSSILEAVYLLCRQNDFNGLQEVIRLRGKISDKKIASDWFLEQVNDIKVEGTFDDKIAKVSINNYPEDTSDFDSTSYIKSIQINSEYDSIKQKSVIRFFTDKDRSTYSDSTKNLCKVIYSSPFFLNEPYRYSEFYYKSVQSKNINRIIRFIHDKILKTVTDIRLTDSIRRFAVEDDNFEKTMDLSSYGEGIQRVFFISLLFASAENGILLIDEFENAIHVELMPDFAQFIDELSKEFNVQVFLTSHSKECIDSFVESLGDNDDVMYCALKVGTEEKPEVIQFNSKTYRKLVRTSNTDLRRAK
ncbi:MAG: AAA family ATPase [Treponema sp.]|nr:AAA family ATPase [Treponema sp.]